jgi:23S rRNA (cytidine1920-2'-O)/16S rRNA (cytidine1409-2'-O)-methyltransferase
MSKLNRLDKELHIRGLTKSRTASSDLILEGKVTVNGKVSVKPSQPIGEDDKLEIIGEQLRYVSRGGLKLEHALSSFEIDLTGKVCLDVGASTGGFTDCMLFHGASRVYAVDVGSNQLHSKLKQDERVISMEQCDIREALLESRLPEKIDFIGVDVSFISVKLVLPVLPESSDVVALIKPQFEVMKRHKGVITDKKLQDKTVKDIVEFSGGKKVIESPILGKSGNREFLMLI